MYVALTRATDYLIVAYSPDKLLPTIDNFYMLYHFNIFNSKPINDINIQV